MTPEGLARAAEILAGARRVVVSTGAGMSKESGIPTFRDAMEGLWAEFDPQALATEAGFRAAPRRVWSWYAWRRRKIGEALPNPGHFAVAELERLVPTVAVVTQNVDGLHAAAGSSDIVELHGNILRLRCLDRAHPFTGTLAEDDDEERDPPPCPVCGSPLRPDVVWFGEVLPEGAMERAWLLSNACDVLLLVGTSGTVWPAADYPRVAKAAGALVIEVNPTPSGLTAIADVFLAGPAGAILPDLVARVRAIAEAERKPGE
ncbi:MAG TPA: NAD-dependent deacylase [Longimicrobium sp.]|nr:NAD-dependent deacylase [Longimicrobium sp.]